MTLSDLSQMFQLRRDTVRVREDLARATHELSSGKTSDISKAVSGNFAPLVTVDRQLSSLDAYDTNASEASLVADMAQTSLERVRSAGDDLALRLMGLESYDISTLRTTFAAEARGAFDSSVSALNSTVAGRSVFAGAATNGAALAPAGDMIADLETLVAGETTAAGVAAALDTWFGPGGGFETGSYLGSANPMSTFKVTEGRQIDMQIKADDPAIRNQLKGLAMAALLEGSGISDAAELDKLAELAGETIIGNQTHMLSLQASVGSSQGRIEEAQAQNASGRTALMMTRNEIVSIDPFSVATELQNLQVQLETIYTITGRLSGLSLTNYLR